MSKKNNNIINRKESKIMIAMAGVLLAVAGTVLVLTGQISTLKIKGDSTSGGYYTCPYGYTLSGTECRKTTTYKATSGCPAGYNVAGNICVKTIYSCPTGYTSVSSNTKNGCRKENYTCPEGYLPNSSKTGCTKQVEKTEYYCKNGSKVQKNSKGYYCNESTCASGYTMYNGKCRKEKFKKVCKTCKDLGYISTDVNGKRCELQQRGSGDKLNCLYKIADGTRLTCPKYSTLKYYKSNNQPYCYMPLTEQKTCPSGYNLVKKNNKPSHCETNASYDPNYMTVKTVDPVTVSNGWTYTSSSIKRVSASILKRKVYETKSGKTTYSYTNKITKTDKKTKTYYCNSGDGRSNSTCYHTDVKTATWISNKTSSSSGSSSSNNKCSYCSKIPDTQARRSCEIRCKS